MAEQEKPPTKDQRKEYFPPKIVHSEKLTASATQCVMADSQTCAPGPLQS